MGDQFGPLLLFLSYVGSLVCFSSFTTSVKESYSHPYDHVTEEPCSDPRTSYRCTRHRYEQQDPSLPVPDSLFLSITV